MSGYTMTQNELLYAFHGAATTTTIATGTQSMIVGCPPIVVQGNYMTNAGSHSSSLRLKVFGLITCTATIPTFTFGVSATSAQPAAFASTNALGTTAAITPTGTTANTPFWMDVDIGLRTLTQVASSVLVCDGEVRCPGAFASPFSATIPAAGSSATSAFWETDLQYFLWPYMALGTATTGNSVTVQSVKLYGEN